MCQFNVVLTLIAADTICLSDSERKDVTKLCKSDRLTY